MQTIKAAIAIVLAVLGVAMFSGSIWMQWKGLPGTAHRELARQEALAGMVLGPVVTENGGETVSVDQVAKEPLEKEADVTEEWAVDHVMLK